MKFSIPLILLFFVTAGAFAQTGKADTFLNSRAKTIVDSIETKKPGTLPYATLYFYRSFIPKISAPIKKVPIYINDSLVYSLKANNMVTLKIFREGKYNIAIDKKGETEIPLKVTFGNEYFFKCEVAVGLWFGKPTIEAVSPAMGKADAGLLTQE